MFSHLFRYSFLDLIRTKEVLFWTLIFPFALSTFMYLAFGNLFETTEKFSTVPVAVVEQKENEAFDTMLQGVSTGEDALMKVTTTDEKEAKKLLNDEKVDGIIYVKDDISLVVKKNGMNQSILQLVLDQFVQYKKTIMDVASSHPQNIQKTLEQLNHEVNYFIDKSKQNGNQDNTTIYFYAVFAMTCLFASFAGCDKVIKIQANVSTLGQRRSVSPTHKMKGILSDFLACELVQFLIVVLLFVYMKCVLRINLGDKTWAQLLILLLGTSYGVMFGYLIGSIPRIGEGLKIGLLTSINLALCVMSDLMISGVRSLIEHNVPILNDINPAALITDSFYALDLYDNYNRFAGNMVSLGVITILLTVICYFLVRRNRYASL